jgi:hypothetical protein
LDLHWSDDDTEQQPMALRGPTNPTGGLTGDAAAFWDSVAAVFGENKWVMYELYNEPHVQDVSVWMDGDAQHVGVLEMMSTVRKHTADSVVIVAGAKGYAYDSASLLQVRRDGDI